MGLDRVVEGQKTDERTGGDPYRSAPSSTARS